MINYLIDCDGGKYGQNCSSLCGHCLKKEQCHYINATCSNGCDSGYRGSECTQGNKQCIDEVLNNEISWNFILCSNTKLVWL